MRSRRDHLNSTSTTPDVLQMEHVSKVYGTGSNAVTALSDVSLQIDAGTFTAVMGPSGSGKSTFLHLAAGLKHPTSGEVTVAGKALRGLSDDALTRFRRASVGFVFQSFQLLPYLTAFQNAELPLRLAGGRIDRRRVAEVLDSVSLQNRYQHLPAELSGGQQQRVAIARALVPRPAVIFADEPTGALDSGSAREVLALLASAARDQGQTIVMVTHDPVAASVADSVVFLADGAIHATMSHPAPEAVAAQMTRLGHRAPASPAAPSGASNAFALGVTR